MTGRLWDRVNESTNTSSSINHSKIINLSNNNNNKNVSLNDNNYSIGVER